MTTAEDSEHWTGPRLTARFIAMKGIAPEPVAHIVARITRRIDGSTLETVTVADDLQPLDPQAADTWLVARLGRTDRLAVAVLVIRETLDARGVILQGTLERRRGTVDGPFSGDPVRVDFAGPANAVRLYRSDIDGRLTEIAPAANTAPPRVQSREQFAGELRALQARFGLSLRILDTREPTLFEDMVGLSSIVHARVANSRDIACGIGWHGNVPFVLEADFPRFAAPFRLPSEDAAALDIALRENNLVRGETRLDQHGIAVVGRAPPWRGNSVPFARLGWIGAHSAPRAGPRYRQHRPTALDALHRNLRSSDDTRRLARRRWRGRHRADRRSKWPGLSSSHRHRWC